MDIDYEELIADRVSDIEYYNDRIRTAHREITRWKEVIGELEADIKELDRKRQEVEADDGRR